MHAGQSFGKTDNSLPSGSGFPDSTIFAALSKAGVSNHYYFTDIPVSALWGQPGLSRSSQVQSFYEQAAAGTLPALSFVDPSFNGESQGTSGDEHPLADVRVGQAFIADIVHAFMESPQWKRGAVFIVYDEWGGFFDHVVPPRVPDLRPSRNLNQDFGQNGLVVGEVLIVTFDEAATSDASSCCGEMPGLGSPSPGVTGPGGGDTGTVLLSPCIAPGTVSETVYNHYSMLGSVENLFGLAHLDPPPRAAALGGADARHLHGPGTGSQRAPARLADARAGHPPAGGPHLFVPREGGRGPLRHHHNRRAQRGSARQGLYSPHWRTVRRHGAWQGRASRRALVAIKLRAGVHHLKLRVLGGLVALEGYGISARTG
jgi:hypothetical protein